MMCIVNPFKDRTDGITLRSRDMRTSAYLLQHWSAIELLTEQYPELRDDSDAIELLSEARRYWSDYSADEINYSTNITVEVSELCADMDMWISANTPDGWKYGGDESDPSYGGFWPVESADE